MGQAPSKSVVLSTLYTKEAGYVLIGFLACVCHIFKISIMYNRALSLEIKTCI